MVASASALGSGRAGISRPGWSRQRRLLAAFRVRDLPALFPRQRRPARLVQNRLPGNFLAKLKFLVDLGFGSDEPVRVQGVDVSPREVLARLLELTPAEPVEPQDCDVLRVIVTGEAGGQQLEITKQIVVLPYRRWGLSAGALDTGVPLAIAGRMLARGAITRRGCHGPEVCVPTGQFFRELAQYNMQVEETARVVR